MTAQLRLNHAARRALNNIVLESDLALQMCSTSETSETFA